MGTQLLRHAQSASFSEYTLCGDAFDAFDSGDADEPVVFAVVGETVTCEDCRRVIDDIKRSYPRGYKRKD